MLDEIELRLSWRTQIHLPLVDRVYKLGHALLTLKEMEFFGEPRAGELDDRVRDLIDHLLVPLEERWRGGTSDGSVVSRVKELRKAVLPDMIEGNLDEQEWQQRWQQLQTMFLAQQLSLYPSKYIASNPTVDRILETVDRFYENLSGEEPSHPPITAVVQVGDAIDVEPSRREDPAADPLLQATEEQLLAMLDALVSESRAYDGA
jgi:hypothetical protein